MKAFLTLEHGSSPLGVLHLELYDRDVPRTVQNFVGLMEDEQYKGSTIHRLIPGFMAQGGDFTKGDGTGGVSIYGKEFEDENFIHTHTKPGTLSMANSGPNTNGSQFFITFRPTAHLDGKHVVFGHVDLAQSADVLDALENIPTTRSDRPRKAVVIVDCGVTGSEEVKEKETVMEVKTEKDEAEIDLDAADDEQPEPQTEPEVEEEDEPEPKTKAEAMKQRLRRLKQKMNQARQLNQQAVREEGERVGSGAARSRRGQKKRDKKAAEKAWEATNGKALAIAASTGVDAKSLVQPGSEAMAKARKRTEMEQAVKFRVTDYHNSEGQHRNYEVNLRSIKGTSYDNASTKIYNPLDTSADDPERERDGSRRLAETMQRKYEKKLEKDRKRKEKEDDGDVAHINKRNKHFNQKISRNYGKATAEIRQNLERGTAL